MTFLLLTSTQTTMATYSQPNTRPALGRPWKECPPKKKAGVVLGLGEDYMTKPPTCFDGKCWDHSNQKTCHLHLLVRKKRLLSSVWAELKRVSRYKCLDAFRVLWQVSVAFVQVFSKVLHRHLSVCVVELVILCFSIATVSVVTSKLD